MPDHHEYCTGGFSPDDIVISGIAGRFSGCKSLEELKEGLLSQRDFLVPNNERYEKGAADLPFGSSGTLTELDKFDVEFFGYSVFGANAADPVQRMLLEVSYEAMADAGYEPMSDFKGAKIGVYTAISNEDGKDIAIHSEIFNSSFAPGYVRSMHANRVSHVFDFHGPSFTVDTACSSGFVALWSAFNDIKEGRVEAALVNAGQVCLSPLTAHMYYKCGIVSKTGECNPFDSRANGMTRTEAITCLFVQKASVARRSYATILDIQQAAAGHVPEGVYVPSFKQEYALFQEVMRVTGVSTNDIQFIETHGTGTQVGDPIEVSAIAAAFCKERTKELYIGSVKSCVGHSESAAGPTGAIKAIFAFESGMVAPNQGFKSPNPNCTALMDGSIKIVTEPLPLTSDYIPVNSFGFGGTIVHALLKRNPVVYPSVPESKDLPRLVLYAATTEAAVFHLLEYIENHPELRAEFFALLNKLSFPPTMLKPFRGYALFLDRHPIIEIKNSLREKKREVWFVMTGMGCQWPGMGLGMMEIKAFADSMKKSAAVLKPLGIDLFELLRKDKQYLLIDRSITPAFVTIAAIQIALVDLLRILEIHPDGIIGHSTGELICAYADGCCTAEQTILSAYWRGRSVETADLVVGGMAAVGLTWEEAVRRCPEGVFPACHNAEDSVTISGLKEPLVKFVAELQRENIFARVVNAYGYAFHCKYVCPASEKLRKSLLEIIPQPRPRSERWVSSSYPEGQWHSDECKMAGPEYFVHNLMSVVRFHDAIERIPSDAIVIEIGPHFLLQSILKRSIGPDAVYIGLMKRNYQSNVAFSLESVGNVIRSNGTDTVYIGLMKRNYQNNVAFFLESVGKLYVEGLNPKIENLYRPVKFPVPRNTPMICDLIEWNHSQSFHVPVWRPAISSYRHSFRVDSTDSYLLDHFIDGRALFPATGYVYLAWEALAKKIGKKSEDINVVIENLKIHRPVILSPATLDFNVTILDSSGMFEIMESNTLVASGKVYAVKNMVFCEPPPGVNKDSSTYISGEVIYDELRIHGYEYGPAFRKLVEASLNGKEGFIQWADNWITFMDSLLLFFLFCNDRTAFVLPTGALYFKICPKVFKSGLEECLKEDFPGVPVTFHAGTKVCRTVGLEIRRLNVDAAPQHIRSDDCIFETYKFVPYVHEHALPRKSLKLEKYKIACNKIIDALEHNLKQDPRRGKFPVKEIVEFDVDSYIRDSTNGYRILDTLKELADIKSNTTTTDAQHKGIFSRFLQNIGKDFANTLLANEYCLRFMFDIISENSFKKLNLLEINNNFLEISPIIVKMMANSSMLRLKEKTLVCKNISEIDNEKCKEHDIQVYTYDDLPSVAKEKSQGIVISTICISTEKESRKHLHLLSTVLEEKGFIVLFHKNTTYPPEKFVASICGEGIDIIPEAVLEQWFQEENLLIVSKISDNLGGNLYLLKHASEPVVGTVVCLSENGLWLDELKKALSAGSKPVWVVADGCPESGVIGMINCLRYEPGGDRIRCVFIPRRNDQEDFPPQFSLDNSFFQDILKKDLLMNIYKDGSWGSYRHIRTEKELPNAEVDYSYVNIKKYGDLSSLMWVESALKYMEIPDRHFVHIYYSALNFRDVMIATGKISAPTEKGLNSTDKCVLGLEYSGRTKYGERVAGICKSRGLATATEIIPEMYFVVPDEWTLEEAATVPAVYITCYYALIVRACLQPGESILIHSGTGGIGQAAIHLALSMKCEIYTTVGTEEKRQYLLKHFPEIKQENIGCSRDTTFERMIAKQTDGRGVDVVLNSLADDKFLASIRCVAVHGRFVEIGKYDLAMDHEIGLKFFLENISFHAVFLDKIADTKPALSKHLMQLLREGIRSGVVKPLDRTVFQKNEVEKAFRYMGKGTHIGKVLIKIRDEEKQKLITPKMLRLPAIPVTYFYSYKTYVIVGGLGGFGIEVTNWLLEKGARKIVLTTRYGARTPYHHFCLKRWKDEGHNITISIRDVSVTEEAAKLLKEAAEIGPIGGIFNSAVILHDAFLENTNWKDFKEVCAPKADATKNLDSLSRRLCPELDHFVCFSSISCGRGNAGQMNYGYANSVMERICEERQKDGYPGLAVQWGIIGEVGVVHRHMGDDAMIAGVGAQRVKSCLNILDISCQYKQPVVCSYVISDSSRKAGDLGDTLQQLARIFGLKDPSEFNTMRSLGEMGVDSMVGIEVRHLLETTCDTTLTMQEIQDLKIDDVKTLIEKAAAQRKKNTSSTTLVSTTCVNLPKSFYHSQAIHLLNDVQCDVPVFIIDIDSCDLSLPRKLAGTIKHPVYALTLSKDVPKTEIESLSSWYLQRIREIAKSNTHVIAISTASILALEMLIQDQKMDQSLLTLTFLNSSSSLLKLINREGTLTEIDILKSFVANYIPSASEKIKEQLANAATLERQVNCIVDLFTKCCTETVNKTELSEVILSHVEKVKLLGKYTPHLKLNKDLFLLEDSSALLANDVAEVKNSLSKVCARYGTWCSEGLREDIHGPEAKNVWPCSASLYSILRHFDLASSISSGKITIQRIPDMNTFNADSVQKISSALNTIFAHHK